MPLTAVLVLFFGSFAVLAGLILLFLLPRTVRSGWVTMRTRNRSAKGRCTNCGYNLKRLTKTRSPECGLGFEPGGDLR